MTRGCYGKSPGHPAQWGGEGGFAIPATHSSGRCGATASTARRPFCPQPLPLKRKKERVWGTPTDWAAGTTETRPLGPKTHSSEVQEQPEPASLQDLEGTVLLPLSSRRT